MLKQLEEKDVDFEEIKKNLDFTASLLEAVYLDGPRWYSNMICNNILCIFYASSFKQYFELE